MPGASANDPALACDRAAQGAETEFGLPRGLLSAIGKVESSRWRPDLRRSVTWPFAIDASGYDIFPETAAQAVAQVRSLQAQGLQSIDVGCFQINLFYHPQAFASLDDGFDPASNAAYAARFLLSLRQRTGSWPAAVAAYHSGDAAFGEPYRARVFAAWEGAGAAGGVGGAEGPADAGQGTAGPRLTRMLAGIVAPGGTAGGPVGGTMGGNWRAGVFDSGTPAMVFAGVRVVVPSHFLAGALPVAARLGAAPGRARSTAARDALPAFNSPMRLPVVVTPTQGS